MSEFTHLIDLASARLGGEAVATNDDFFAEKENLVKPEPPIFIPGKYTDRGKWMDGWESRRRRTPGHDWCIVKLGVPGIVHTLIVDTSFFTGNFPSHCWIEGCGLPAGADPTADSVTWHPVLGRVELGGDAKNTFSIPAGKAARRFTHLRLNIFPDGGVARLRVMGEVMPDWTRILSAGRDVDLAAAVNGGYVVDTSDRFYGDARNMLMPYTAANMGDGWETKRRRGPGHDWAVLHLGIAGAIHHVELDTAHFKGNYPDTASLEGAVMEDGHGGVSADLATRTTADWHVVLPQTKLQADHLHTFQRELQPDVVATHVRLNIFPDGGVSRFRVRGTPTPVARRRAVLRQLNALDEPELRAELAGFCGAPSWIDRMAAARPYAAADDVLRAAEAAAGDVPADDWHEAFRHHPRIGERTAERSQSPVASEASAREQASLQQAGAGADLAADVAALREGNRAYEDRFGHIFIVCASGRSPTEMLAALRERMNNDPATELQVAAGEQRKITRLRLERLLG